MADVVLKPGRVRPVWAGHPWVFAQGIAKRIGPLAAGDEVRVLDPKGHVLGRGLFSPESAIQVRLYTRQADQALDAALIEQRLRQALARRRALGLPNEGTTGYRVLNGEGDDLPGMVVDQLGDVTMLQLLTIGMKRRQQQVVEALQRVLAPAVIVDRTPQRSAKLEGFEAGSGVLAGDSGRNVVSFLEDRLRFELPLGAGQKTGFYLDMRALRQRLASFAKGRRVLDCYAYVGAAGLHMARAGAEHVLSVDSSQAAVDIGRHCIALNGLGDRMTIDRMDAREALDRAAAESNRDLVLCDPPKLMPRRANADKAQHAMQSVAKAAVLATRPGGLVVLCSCSAGLGLTELGRALAVGAKQAKRRATVIDRVFQDVDHPVPAAFPDGLYLSSVIAEVTLEV